MLHGLQAVVTAKELAERLDRRSGAHDTRKQELEQLLANHKDSLYIFLNDRCKTVDDIEAMIANLAARVETLTLLRDGLTDGETYTLGLADLRAADLLQDDGFDEDEDSDSVGRRQVCAFKRVPRSGAAPAKAAPAASIIDGVKLTIHGAELRKILEEAAEGHDRRADHWKREAVREDGTEEHPCLPTHMCENEAERQEWRADVLRSIRDHIEESASYRVGREDLDFAELLPDKPGWLEQDEFEERTKVGFSLERLVKAVEQLGPIYLPDIRSSEGVAAALASPEA